MLMCSYCLNSLSFHNRLFGTIPELHSQRSLELDLLITKPFMRIYKIVEQLCSNKKPGNLVIYNVIVGYFLKFRCSVRP